MTDHQQMLTTAVAWHRRRYLDACHDYNLAHALDHPRQGFLETMRSYEASLATWEAALARSAEQAPQLSPEGRA